MERDKESIDALTAAFFDAFTMREGRAPNIDSLYDLLLPGALVVQNVGGAGQVLDAGGFVEPRRALLGDGRMERFREWETQGRTELFGNIAHRFSRYQKFWTASGRPYGGTGAKTLQFVRTQETWKISSLAWDDDLLIRPLEAADVGRTREIDAACFAPDDRYDEAQYQTMADSPESIVAVERGLLVGYAFVQRTAQGELRVRSLAVHPQHRRRGYGQALIATAIECSSGRLDLLVAESNTSATTLYERMGFTTAQMCEPVPGRRRMLFTRLARSCANAE